MSGTDRHPEPVRVLRRPLWRLRVAREAPRYLLYGFAIAGTAAAARLALAPPGGAAPRPAAVASGPDLGAEAYATLFARRYLTWTAADPQSSARELASFAGPAVEAADGFATPKSGSQQVLWAEVVQSREPAYGEHVYTVAAQTDVDGLLYLTVDVARAADGSLELDGYPAFVGPPASHETELPRLREVDDSTLATVVARGLRNYLDGASGELEADLSPGARVTLPTSPLSLTSVQHIDWAPEGSAVIAVVTADDARGAQYTLEYELDVVLDQGRWEISAVQTDPDD